MEHSPNTCKTCESKCTFRNQIKENLLSDLIYRNASLLQGNANIIKIWTGQFRISSKQYDATRAPLRAQSIDFVKSIAPSYTIELNNCKLNMNQQVKWNLLCTVSRLNFPFGLCFAWFAWQCHEHPCKTDGKGAFLFDGQCKKSIYETRGLSPNSVENMY